MEVFKNVEIKFDWPESDCCDDPQQVVDAMHIYGFNRIEVEAECWSCYQRFTVKAEIDLPMSAK